MNAVHLHFLLSNNQEPFCTISPLCEWLQSFLVYGHFSEIKLLFAALCEQLQTVNMSAFLEH